MMKKTILLSSLVLAAMLSAAEVLLDSKENTPELWDSDKVKVEDGVNRINGNALILSRDFYPVSPEQRFRLSGQFRAATDKTGKFFFGFVPYDAEKQRIELHHVNALYQTETELAAPCAANDRVLTVKNAMNWKADPFCFIAFDAKDDFSDLPNRKLSSQGIEKVEKVDDGWKVTLKKPCGLEYPAGAKIRLQGKGSQFICSGAFSRDPGKEWSSCANMVSGLSKKGESRTQFWAGTRFVKVAILGNYMCDDKIGLNFRTIKLERLD